MARHAGNSYTRLARGWAGAALAIGLLAVQVASSHHAAEFGHGEHSHDEHGSCVFLLASAEIFLLPLAPQDRAPSLHELPATTDSFRAATRALRANRIRAPPTFA